MEGKQIISWTVPIFLSCSHKQIGTGWLRLRDALSDMFLKFASVAPEIDLSPDSRAKTYLGKRNRALPSPSPTSKMKRMVLKDPTKKGLADYDKHMASHEAAIKKGLSELDKATFEFRESFEMREAEKQKLAEKLSHKRKKCQEVVSNARRTLDMISVFSFHFSEGLLSS